MLAHLQRRFNDAADEATPISLFGSQPASSAVASARVDIDAVSRMRDLQKTLGEHRSGVRQHAWYSRIIELRSENLEELARWESVIVETLRKVGFGIRIEDLHAADAWLATHGANGYNFVRRTAAHGVTVGDFSNMTDAWRGRVHIKCDKCEPGTEPMAWVRRAETLSPFALDLHAGEGDVMSASGGGPIRQGKTSLTNFLMGHFAKTARDWVVGFTISAARSERPSCSTARTWRRATHRAPRGFARSPASIRRSGEPAPSNGANSLRSSTCRRRRCLASLSSASPRRSTSCARV